MHLLKISLVRGLRLKNGHTEKAEGRIPLRTVFRHRFILESSNRWNCELHNSPSLNSFEFYLNDEVKLNTESCFFTINELRWVVDLCHSLSGIMFTFC